MGAHHAVLALPIGTATVDSPPMSTAALQMHPTTNACLLALDWGTSSLRGALIDATGRVLAERSSADGILHVGPGQFASVFEANFRDWTIAGDPNVSEILISGMAGSRQGWREAAYCACPAGFDELAAALCWLEGLPPTWPASLRIAIVPGLCLDEGGVPDVMRGEEIQVFGALAAKRRRGDPTNGLYVLPGTHSKWVQVRDERIVQFRTCMTGEIYALLAQQSLLARSVDPSAPLDEAAFIDGVLHAGSAPAASLLATAFGVRTLGLLGRRTPGQLASLLSGLVIGEELRVMAPAPASMGRVDLIGSPALCERYALALQTLGIASQSHGAEVTWAGLHAMARACGMIPR